MLANEIVLSLERWVEFRGSFLVLDFAGILMRWKAALGNQTIMLEFLIKQEAIARLLIRIIV